MRASICIVLAWSALSLSGEDSWKITGTIKEVSEENTTILIQHDGIPGYDEEPGELELAVGSGDYALAADGRKIRGELVLKDEQPYLQAVWPADEITERIMTTINRDLTRPRIGAVNKGNLKVGDEIPRFAMYNQNGDLVTPADLENKVVVMNFIFTRGSVPSMSRATVKRMAELQDRLEDAELLESVVLLSLSLDPEFDTPGICYSFLQKNEVDHSSYWMLTGSRKTLNYLTKKIGVVSAPSEKTIINHSMVVLIVDKEGKIFHRIPGTRWKLEEVYSRCEILLNTWN